MPAIQLSTLNKQIEHIVQEFNNPDRFLHELRDLFEYYSNRTHRPGFTEELEPIQDHFHLPKPLLRQIQLALSELPTLYPDEALNLAVKLWEQPYYEHQLLSVFLLGQVPGARGKEVLNLIQQFGSAAKDPKILKSIADSGLSKILLETPDLLLKQVEDWIDSPDITFKRLGLYLLITIIEEQSFENIPSVLTLIAPFMRNINDQLRYEILKTVIALAKRSPTETAYILKQQYEIFKQNDTTWLIRRSLDYFPPQLRKSLQDKIRLK